MTPPAPTLAALLRLPTVLDFDGVCAALRISPSQGYKLQAAGQFPIAPLPHSGRKRLYPLAEVIRYLGFDPALVAARPAA